MQKEKDSETVDPVHESAKEVFEPMATTEFTEYINKLKYDNRRVKVLYKRSLGRIERKRLKEKYRVSNRP